MANYAVTDHTTAVGSLEDVAAAMETYIETIDTTKTIRLFQIFRHSGAAFQGVVIHDA